MNHFKLVHGSQDRAHLVLCVQQTGSGCLWQQMSYLQVWTSAWTRRRGSGSGWRSKPQRTCNRTHQVHWIWHELYWCLQKWGEKKKHIMMRCSRLYSNSVIILSKIERSHLLALSQLSKRWHYCHTLHTWPLRNPCIFFSDAIRWWPVFRYFHLLIPFPFLSVAV